MREFQYTPVYLERLGRGDLRRRAAQARARMTRCDLCPYVCHANRNRGPGVCGIAAKARLISFIPHFGELPALAGWRGSGAVFLEGQPLVFRSTTELPRPGVPTAAGRDAQAPARETGREMEPDELARILLELQGLGCHNINLLFPTFVVAQILEALALAVEGGLRLPLIYNTQGYNSFEALRMLEGVVDVFATDMLVGYARDARRYLKLSDYPRVNRLAVREMHRQVGDLLLSSEGLALRGLLVRHWVLPNRVAGTTRVAGFLSHEISPDTFLYLLDDYRPAKGIKKGGTLGRAPMPDEMDLARRAALAAGLRRVVPGPLATLRLAGTGGPEGQGGPSENP